MNENTENMISFIVLNLAAVGILFGVISIPFVARREQEQQELKEQKQEQYELIKLELLKDNNQLLKDIKDDLKN